MRKYLLIPVILYLTIAPGWAWKTKAHLEERLHATVGRDADDLVREWGAPDSEYTYKDGSKDLIFQKNRSFSTVAPVFGLYYGPRPVITSNLSCKVTLRVGLDNKINHWAYVGNDCKADPPQHKQGNSQ